MVGTFHREGGGCLCRACEPDFQPSPAETECDGSCVERPHRWSPSGARCVRTGCDIVGTGDPCGDGECEGTD